MYITVHLVAYLIEHHVMALPHCLTTLFYCFVIALPHENIVIALLHENTSFPHD